MALSTELSDFPRVLREALVALIPTAEMVDVSVGGADVPLVLMTRGHAIHAFAVGNEEDYPLLYGGFKALYLENGSSWASKDLSFVFCLPSGSEATEKFCSAIEVDVFFCRKYVVTLEPDLAGSLARLPFLPLSRLSGESIRPPTAQTLLRKRRIKAELARALVEPGTASATILAGCLSGRYGPAEVIDEHSVAAPMDTDAAKRKQTTLKSIAIENFRAYRRKQDFEFGSAVTVLYGPNGFGKTSFFDAFDFAVTGSAGRLERAKGGFAKVAKHLDSADEATRVSLCFEQDGTMHTICRDLAQPNDATLDGVKTARKAILSALTGGESAPTDRVENLVALFRATHLFSQDRQALTGEVADNCVLPADLVSRMLAFDDYVNGVKKAGEVLKSATNQLRVAKAEALEAGEALAADSVELARLQSLAAVSTSQDALDTGLRELKLGVEEAGLELGEVDHGDVRTLRAMLEAQGEGAERKRATLEFVRKQVAPLRALQAQLSAHDELQSREKRLLVQLRAEEAKSSREDAFAATEFAARQSQEQESLRQRDWMAWAVSVQPEYVLVGTECAALSERKGKALLAQAHHRAAHDQAATAFRQAATDLSVAHDAYVAAGDRRARLHAVSDMVVAAETVDPMLVAAQSQESAIAQETITQRSLLMAATQATKDQAAKMEAAKVRFSHAQKEASKLQAMLAELRMHVSGAACLLCGHDHGENASLLAAIDRQAQHGSAAVTLGQVLVEERSKQLATEAQQTACELSVSQSVQRELVAKAEREALERRKENIFTALASVGMTPSDGLAAEHTLKVAEAIDEEGRSFTSLHIAQAQQALADKNLDAARRNHEASDGEVMAAFAALEERTQRLDQLVTTARQGGIDLDTGLDRLVAAQRAKDEALTQARASLREIAELVEQRHSTFNSAVAALAVAQDSQKVGLQARERLSFEVQSLISSIVSVGFDADVTDEQLVAMISHCTAQAALIRGLRDRAAQLEVAVNAAATSAAFDSIGVRIAGYQRRVDEAQARAREIEPWVKYFDGIVHLLSGQQALATSHFTTQYGPRTGVIQRRLRPVYGFEDIEVASRDGGIEIQVTRKGEALRPTDFFSQSQVQTLVLGLFLTACSSQTWSGFSSIMMDDPVTHFDDLNNYALLDLILGLQSSDEGDRQFVISTCDEKLLQLARQKFQHLGSAAKFYRFSAIGGEGPMVAELPG